MTTNNLSSDVFNKIRSKFGDIQLGDSEGNVTADPSGAQFYDFEYTEDSDTFGRMSISLADGETMKVFYNRQLTDKIDETSKQEFFNFLKELKDLAVQHQLGFDVRDITKSNLSTQDFKNLADTNKTVNTDEMSEELNRITKLAGVDVKESLTGTAKRSYENLDKTRLVIRHSGKVDEEVPGSRSRHIESLYIENEDGERFKYPITHLAGARAMTRHVANGGRPHDEFGQHIVQTSENIAKLNSFSRYVSHKDQLNDNAGDIIEQTKLKLENLRTYMKSLNKQSHYDETFKNFKTTEDQELDDETKDSYREKFTMKHLDDRVENALPLIHRIMSEFKPSDDDKDAKVEPPVDHGAIVQGWLTNPDKRLVLRKDETADKMLSVTKFNNKNTMLGSILSDIASRMLTTEPEDDRVANFASRIADDLEKEGEAFFNPDKDYVKNKKIAIQLARRYIDDYKKMQNDPAYASEVRKDPNEVIPRKDRHGKTKEDPFESWADRVTEGTWSLPDDPKNYNELKGIMSQHFDVGTDAVNATTWLSKFGFGDDSLYDTLGSLYDKDGEKADARPVIKDYVTTMLVPTGHYDDSLTPEMKAGLMTAVSVYKDELATAESQPDAGSERADAAQGMWASSKEIQSKFKTWQDFMNSEEFDDYLQDDTNQLEGLTFEDIKPYVSMYKGDDGKVVHDVLDKGGKSAYKTNNAKDAMNYLSKNFGKLRGQAPKVKDFIKSEDTKDATKGKYSDKEIKQAKGIAFDKRYKGGNYTGAHNTINKLKKGLSDHPDVADALKRANENITEPLKESRTKIVEAIKNKADTGFNIAGIEGEDDRVTGDAGLQIARLKYLSTYQ